MVTVQVFIYCKKTLQLVLLYCEYLKITNIVGLSFGSPKYEQRNHNTQQGNYVRQIASQLRRIIDILTEICRGLISYF